MRSDPVGEGEGSGHLRGLVFLVDENQPWRLLAGRLRCRFRRRLLYEMLPRGDLLRQAAHPRQSRSSERR